MNNKLIIGGIAVIAVGVGIYLYNKNKKAKAVTAANAKKDEKKPEDVKSSASGKTYGRYDYEKASNYVSGGRGGCTKQVWTQTSQGGYWKTVNIPCSEITQ